MRDGRLYDTMLTNPPVPLKLLRQCPNFMFSYRGVNACLAECLNSVLNVKAVVATFNQMIVQLHRLIVYSTSHVTAHCPPTLRYLCGQLAAAWPWWPCQCRPSLVSMFPRAPAPARPRCAVPWPTRHSYSPTTAQTVRNALTGNINHGFTWNENNIWQFVNLYKLPLISSSLMYSFEDI